MAVYEIKDFSEIDFVSVNPAEDVFALPDGMRYVFSDHICDFCSSGGTVLETEGSEKAYFCVLCENELRWCEFANDFLPPTGDILKFLLPKKWTEQDLANWYQDYQEQRLTQETVRERILREGKE